MENMLLGALTLLSLDESEGFTSCISPSAMLGIDSADQPSSYWAAPTEGLAEGSLYMVHRSQVLGSPGVKEAAGSGVS